MKARSIISIISFIVGALLMMLLMKKCNPCPEIGSTETTVNKTSTETIKYDSTYKAEYFALLDLIPVEDTTSIKKLPKRLLKKVDQPDEKDPCGPIRKFITLVNDSNDQAKITGKITSLTRGELLSTDFEFKLKSLVVNKTVETTNTNTITNNNYIISNKLYLGLESSFSPAFYHISGTVDLAHKKGFIIGYRYEQNLQFNYGSHNFKIAKLISLKKKDKSKQ